MCVGGGGGGGAGDGAVRCFRALIFSLPQREPVF